MQCSMQLITCVLALLIAQPVQAVTPIAKVVEMLEGMLVKGKEEKQAEAVQYAKYEQFCKDIEAEKTTAIEEADQEIINLKADIQVSTQNSATLTTEVTTLNGDLATFEGDVKAANAARKIEKEDYDKIHKDYTESIDAIRQAIDILKTQGSKTYAQATGLLQSRFANLPQVAHRAIEAFLAQAADPYVPPQAHGYEFQSRGVLDMLEELAEKFMEERTTLEKEELKKRHAHEMQVADTTDSIKMTKKSIEVKSHQKAKDDGIVADKSGALKETEATRKADSEYLTDTKQICTQKGTDFEVRQKLRADELTALGEAIALLKSPEIMGHGEKYLPTDFLQRSPKSPVLVQLKRSQQGPSNQLRVAAYLHDEGERVSSPMLLALSVRVREDPFAKVKQMIRELIDRLEAQAGDEASHKSWCEAELATNQQARTTKSSAVDTLTGEIETTEADIAKTGLQIQELELDLATLNTNIDKDNTFRQEEQTKNEQTIADAKEAQTAVARAITILKEFYDRAVTSEAFLQEDPQPTAPAIFDSPYKGQGPDGVIAMLEVIESDFLRLASETEADEAKAKEEYTTKNTASLVDKAEKETDIKGKTTRKSTLEGTLQQKKTDLLTTQKELSAANEYYEKLKPSCLETGVSYQEREQRRQEEIQSLEEALRILNGEDLAGQ
mmetsp:Transcript_107877/g.196377  ORF Transcript_107877/g.196377 Transcript_107877/m.196377 type:complete len:670 (-) Transcript_107877:49-2058(-)